MKMTSPIAFRVLLLVLATGLIDRSLAGGPDAPKPIYAEYDEKADGALEVANALTMAKATNKRVLLQFGANWCGPCRKLHCLYRDNSAIVAEVAAHYVVVFLDVNAGHNKDVDARYGYPTRAGLPALVVLDADGRVVSIPDMRAMAEGNHHNSTMVLAFLKSCAVRP